MNVKFFVPYETAKTLKEKGCPQDTDYYWMVRGKEEPHGVTLHDKLDYEDDWGVGFATFIPAPTYHEAVDWLEEKGVQVWSYYDGDCWFGSIRMDKRKSAYYTNNYFTREQALNAAILKALEVVQ